MPAEHENNYMIQTHDDASAELTVEPADPELIA